MEEMKLSQLHSALGETYDRVLHRGPVMVSRYNRDRIILISVEDYHKALRNHDNTQREEK
jgi:PHD/YefM family antitoxin component YafN of YafNO toxin-antitoxin module